MGIQYRVDRARDYDVPVGMCSLLYLGDSRTEAFRVFEAAPLFLNTWGKADTMYGVLLSHTDGDCYTSLASRGIKADPNATKDHGAATRRATITIEVDVSSDMFKGMMHTFDDHIGAIARDIFRNPHYFTDMRATRIVVHNGADPELNALEMRMGQRAIDNARSKAHSDREQP